MYHGPIVYEDQSGTMESLDDIYDPFEHREWFTKRCRYSHEREYRFCRGYLGNASKKHFLSRSVRGASASSFRNVRVRKDF